MQEPVRKRVSNTVAPIPPRADHRHRHTRGRGGKSTIRTLQQDTPPPLRYGRRGLRRAPAAAGSKRPPSPLVPVAPSEPSLRVPRCRAAGRRPQRRLHPRRPPLRSRSPDATNAARAVPPRPCAASRVRRLGAAGRGLNPLGGAALSTPASPRPPPPQYTLDSTRADTNRPPRPRGRSHARTRSPSLLRFQRPSPHTCPPAHTFRRTLRHRSRPTLLPGVPTQTSTQVPGTGAEIGFAGTPRRPLPVPITRPPTSHQRSSSTTPTRIPPANPRQHRRHPNHEHTTHTRRPRPPRRTPFSRIHEQNQAVE